MTFRAVIAGVGHTEYGRLSGRSPQSMIAEAARNAIADAGIDKERIDGVLVKYPSSRPAFMYGQRIAEALGLQPRVGGVWDQGGAASAGLVVLAAQAIASGQCEIALVCFGDNPKSGGLNGYGRAHGDDALHGWFSTAAGYAMIARRYLQEFGAGAEHLGAVAMACRAHGARNPLAQLRKPLDLEGYLRSPYVVSPLRRDDCALVSDGGAALIVMSEQKARQLGVPAPVPILGYGQGHTSWDVAQRPVLTSTMARAAGATAFRMAGMSAAQIDVAQIYDCFTITVLMTLEDYGICPPGRAGYFAAEGNLGLGGALPTNTSGGLLSETGMPGLQLVVEGVRQMRGTATVQVPDARTCLVSNQGGTMHTHTTLILGQ